MEKARLVAKGFMDRDRGNFPTEVATPHKESSRLLLWLFTELQWAPRKDDAKQAFLQSDKMCSFRRKVFLYPPSEANIPVTHVWAAERSIYGLDDGPHEWMIELHLVLIDEEFVRLDSDGPLLFSRSVTWPSRSVPF